MNERQRESADEPRGGEYSDEWILAVYDDVLLSEGLEPVKPRSYAAEISVKFIRAALLKANAPSPASARDAVLEEASDIALKYRDWLKTSKLPEHEWRARGLAAEKIAHDIRAAKSRSAAKDNADV